MPPSSVVARSIALAIVGLAVVPAALGQNVTAFNPFSGVGLPGGPVPQYGPQAAYPIVDTVGPGPIAGPAFNPWQPPAAPPGMAMAAPFVVRAGPAPAFPASPTYDPGSFLPPPPPGPIESRIVAIPEIARGRGAPRELHSSAAPRPTPVEPAFQPPAPMPAPVAIAPPVAPPVARPVAPSVATAAPTPAPVARPQPAPPPAPVAAAPAPRAAAPAVAPAAVAPAAVAPVAPPPPRPVAAAAAPPVVAPPGGPVAAAVAFAGRSADLSDGAKAELDHVARNVADRGLRQIELRAYATGTDPDSRKVALARALVVRSYLIDKGVKSRIEIGAFSGGGGDRVDILVPNS